MGNGASRKIAFEIYWPLSWVTNKFENIEIAGKIIAFQIKTYNPSLLLESEKLFMVGVFIFPKKPPISDSYFLHLIIVLSNSTEKSASKISNPRYCYGANILFYHFGRMNKERLLCCGEKSHTQVCELCIKTT